MEDIIEKTIQFRNNEKKKRSGNIFYCVNNNDSCHDLYHQLVSLIITFPCGKTTCFLRTTTGPPTEHRKRETRATSHGSARSFLVSLFQKPELTRREKLTLDAIDEARRFHSYRQRAA